jgi:hypothetical protein
MLILPVLTQLLFMTNNDQNSTFTLTAFTMFFQHSSFGPNDMHKLISLTHHHHCASPVHVSSSGVYVARVNDEDEWIRVSAYTALNSVCRSEVLMT